MKRQKLLALGMAVSLAAGAAWAAVEPISLPPYIVTGRIVNYDHADLSSTATTAEVRARKNGVLIARCTLRAIDDSPNNFALSIPITSQNFTTSAMVGEFLTFEIDDGVNVYTDTNVTITVGSPGRVGTITLAAAKDSDGDGVADEYVDSIAGLMYENGITAAYDPAADYDHDGMSNRAEYQAGTDPFSDTDNLRILSIAPVAENESVMVATFLAHENRAYSVQQKSPTNDFTMHTFQKAKESGATPFNYFKTGNENEPVRTIYLFKSGPSQLYRVHLE